VKIPVVVRYVTPAYSLSIKIDDIKHGVQIDDAKFVKPSN
jgi:hypothetical protein